MPTHYPKICEYCNTEFKVLSRAKSQRFCSVECARDIKRRIREHINCLHCGKSLNSGQFKFCCNSCSASFNNKGIRRHGKSLEEKAHPCAQCGKIIFTKSKCCSDHCKNIFKTIYFGDEKLKRKLDAGRIAQRLYQAKKLRTIDPHADKQKIKQFYENCPIGYEVDHYIPLTRGGKHHEDNLQYLTSDENKRKGNKMPWEYQVRED